MMPAGRMINCSELASIRVVRSSARWAERSRTSTARGARLGIFDLGEWWRQVPTVSIPGWDLAGRGECISAREAGSNSLATLDMQPGLRVGPAVRGLPGCSPYTAAL